MKTIKYFDNRTQAGQLLARELRRYANQPNTIVIALPRGGVPVGHAVAKALHLPLDILVVRKLGLPGHEEFAIGAIASGGFRTLQSEMIQAYDISPRVIDAVCGREMLELERREQLYRRAHPRRPLAGLDVILVDDGLATGATMTVAMDAVRHAQAARIIVAVPVGAPDTVAQLAKASDELVCLLRPERFFSVGNWYLQFDQTDDDEVLRLLDQASQWDQVVPAPQPAHLPG